MDRAAALSTWFQDRSNALGLARVDLPRQPRCVALGFDGSDQSLEAATWAAHLGQDVHVVTGLDISAAVFLPAEEAPLTPAWAESIRSHVDEANPALAEHLSGCEVKHHVLETGPSRAMMQTARDANADIMVVGSQGKGWLQRATLGSVAEALCHHAEPPVLVSRGPWRAGPIVAGVGEDPGSSAAVAWAARLALMWDRDLVLAHAAHGVPEPRTIDTTGPRASLAAIPWPPKAGFQELAEEIDPALLVVGHRTSRRWLGSTAVSLIRNAPCSVLVARGAGAASSASSGGA
ncbi:MAG: universal stress protein [Candidatus Thermoplasmatota archaeon]|nr:universal stress protein [Candidatus Thermoplasmatota archaeon]